MRNIALILLLAFSSAFAQTKIDLGTQVKGNLPVGNLNSGTGASGSTYWRGDGTWAAPAGSGTVNAGTTGQIAVYAGNGTVLSGSDPACSITGSVGTGKILYGTGTGTCAYTPATTVGDAGRVFQINSGGTGVQLSPVVMPLGAYSGGLLYGSGVDMVASSVAGTAGTMVVWGGAGNPPLASNLSGILVGNGSNSAVTAITPGTGVSTFLATPTIANLNAAISDADVPIKVASGTATFNPGALTSGSCSTAITVAATGVATTDHIGMTFNADMSATTGYSGVGGLVTVYKYPTADNVNFKICNWTSSSITPTSVTVNWRVTR